jgi:hypothetical protein
MRRMCRVSGLAPDFPVISCLPPLFSCLPTQNGGQLGNAAKSGSRVFGDWASDDTAKSKNSRRKGARAYMPRALLPKSRALRMLECAGWGLFLINSHCPGFTLGNIPAWTKSVNLIKSLPFRLQTSCFQLCLDSISSAWFSLILLGVVGSLQAVLTQFDDSRCAVTRASSTRAYSAPESRPRNKPAALCSIYFARVWYLPHRKSNEVG